MQTGPSMSRQINHKTMRVVVGIIALVLSPLTYFLSGVHLTSISGSYWTDAQDIFVGSLVAVGFFLSAYNGAESKRDLEFYLSKFACLFALCVAFFPTEDKIGNGMPAVWIESISGALGLKTMYIHYGAAVALFVSLVIMMWFFSVRAKMKGKQFRAYLYRGISIAMAVGIIGFIIAGQCCGLKSYIFWLEFWGLSLFGLGWLIAGSYKTEG